jgi:hypothetical protein
VYTCSSMNASVIEPTGWSLSSSEFVVWRVPSGGHEIPSRGGLHHRQVHEEGEPTGRRERRAPIGEVVAALGLCGLGTQEVQAWWRRAEGVHADFFREVDKVIRIGIFFTIFSFFS